jgi:hypothetical protein
MTKDSERVRREALMYEFNLFVVARSALWQAGAVLAKGGIMLAFGLGVLGEAGHKLLYPVMLGVETMGLPTPRRTSGWER